MALGKKNSGAISSNRTILGNLGIAIDKDYDLLYGGYCLSAEALRNGQVGKGSPSRGHSYRRRCQIVRSYR